MKRFYIILFFLSFTLLQSCFTDDNNINKSTESIDSIPIWIKNAKNSSYSILERKSFLRKAYRKNSENKRDLLQVRNFSNIAFRNLKLGDTLLFKQQNKMSLKLAEKLKDTFSIGDIHWNYATYYNLGEELDSSYYHFNIANKYFKKANSRFEEAKTLYGMAFIRGRFKDYSSAEILIFRAIKIFEELENSEELFSCYNYLSQLENDILDFERSLHYQTIALSYVEKIKSNDELYETSFNNFGLTYLEKGEFKKALYYFDKKLKNREIKQFNKESYAITIDNKAYCKLLMNETDSVYNFFKEALEIRDSLNDNSGMLISKIHLSEYYAFTNDTLNAIKYANEANKLAKSIKNGRDYLKTLDILAKLEKKNSEKYFERYIEYSDSLQLVERKIQNKFTRIEYETDKYIEKSNKLSQQKLLVILFSFFSLFIGSLIFFILNQKAKNKRLILENEHQKANEIIYFLTLKQQEKIEEQKIKESNRISEELHDGILGRLFGVRVSIGFLEIVDSEHEKQQHQKLINELQDIEKDIREVSHELNDNFDSSKINFNLILNKYIENICQIDGLKYNLKINENINWSVINNFIKINLYRIIQEAMQNILNHSKAKNIEIVFEIDKDFLYVKIKDDGIGFVLKKSNSGIGIKNIKSRIKKINGVCTITSKINEGTIINIKIPIK